VTQNAIAGSGAVLRRSWSTASSSLRSASRGARWWDSIPVPGGRGAVVGFAIAGAYFTCMDSELRDGQTVGKWLLGIQVVHRDGSLLARGSW